MNFLHKLRYALQGVCRGACQGGRHFGIVSPKACQGVRHFGITFSKVAALSCVLLLTSTYLTGCGKDTAATATQGYSVTDKRGTKLDFKQKPQRIVSLMPSTDEILYSLVDHSRILALSRWARNNNFSNITEEAKKFPLVASNSPEFLLKNKADLVITRDDMGQNPAQLKSLEDMHIPIYVFEGPQSIQGIRELILKIGEVVGEQAGAQTMVQKMDARLKEIRQRSGEIPLEQQKTVVCWSGRGIIGGKGTLLNDILKQAQVKDGLEKHPSRTSVSKEFVVSSNPDYIIVMSYEYQGKNPANMVQEILSDSSLATVKAVKNKQVILLPIKYISCNSQYVVEAVDRIAKTIYGK